MRIAKYALIAVAVLFLAGVFSCTKPVEKKIGLQLYSVRDDMRADPVAAVTKLGKIGYSEAEAAGYDDGKFYGMNPVEFKKLLNDNGMEFISSHTGQACPDSSNWDEVMAWWDQCIDAHVAAGVKYIVQPFMDNKGYELLEGLKAYCDYFNAVGEKCAAKGVKFGYHNHSHEFEEIDGVRRYDFMLQNTDPEKVFFQMDLYWITKGGQNPVDYFNKYPGRFKLWHVKDETELGGDDAIMDFAPIFASANLAGMEHYIVEVERYHYDPMESVKMSYDFLEAAEFVKQ